MTVKLVFLGKLAGLAGMAERDLVSPLDWVGVLAALPLDLAEAVADGKVRVAVNGELLVDKSALSARSGDEVAFLPPVSGG